MSPLKLPQNCPRATTCAVELTLLDGSKAAIISCYLPQTTEAHAATCEALSQLPRTLPHSIIIMGGTSRETRTDRPQRTNTSPLYHTNDGGGLCSPPSHRTSGRYRSRVSTTLHSGTRKVSHFKRKTRKRSRQLSSIITGSRARYNYPFFPKRTCPS